MKRALLRFSFYAFILFSLALSLKAETVVAFISGDWDYLGGTKTEDERLALLDQARQTYTAWVDMAEYDKSRNYVIFFDPRGKGRIFNRKWVQLRVYQKGKKRYALRAKSEISAGLSAFSRVNEMARKYLGSEFAKDQKILFYYGEHFPMNGKARIDLTGSPDIGASELMQGMASLGFFKRALFQTCYLNNLRFIAPMLGLAEEILVPERAVLNHLISPHLLLQNQKGPVLARALSSGQYVWTSYGKEVLPLAESMRKLEQNVSAKHLAHFRTIKNAEQFEAVLQDRFPQALFLSPTDIELPLWDVVTLYDQYLLRGEEELEAIEKWLDLYPHLERIYDEI